MALLKFIWAERKLLVVKACQRSMHFGASPCSSPLGVLVIFMERAKTFILVEIGNQVVVILLQQAVLKRNSMKTNRKKCILDR